MKTLEHPLPDHVSIREVGPRDGLQIEAPVPTATKLDLIAALVATGVRRIEATSFVSPSAVPALADAERVAEAFADHPQVTFSALVASLTGARRALAAGVRAIEYVVSASEAHSRANVGIGVADAVALLAPISELVHGAGGELEVIVATAWDCPFAGATDPAHVVAIADAAVSAGADRLCLGDTIGTTTPTRTVDLLVAVAEVTGAVDLGGHFHDTRGTGIANAFAAVQAGVTSLDSSVGGLGGCPFAPGASGNIATEELVYLLEGSGVSTGVDLDRVLAAAALAEVAVGHPLTSSLFRAGGVARPLGVAAR